MKKLAIILGIITVLSSLLFLYFGNIFLSFNTSSLAFVLGIIFEISLFISAVIFMYLTARSRNFSSFFLFLLCLFSWIVHVGITFFHQFTPAYSYAMDVFIVIVYMYHISTNIKSYWSLSVR